MKVFISIACFTLLLTCLACDDGPNDAANHEDETIETFLANFASEYSQMDSTGYARYLDPGYRFYPYPDALDPSMPELWWDRAEELVIAGRMFRARPGWEDITVSGIQLDLSLLTAAEDTTGYPGKPAGETWYKVTAEVDLVVGAEDPNDGGGDGFINFRVRSGQIFVFRPDPGGGNGYVVCRQDDQPSIRKASETLPLGVEETSWGRVKAIFRSP